MSQITGTIQGVRNGQPESTDYGALNVYYLDIVAPNGQQVQGGKLRAKTYEPKVGEEISVKVDASSDPPFLQKFNPEYDGKQSSNGSGPRGGNEGQIIGWAHTLAAFELAHNIQHSDVIDRANEILSARAQASATPPPWQTSSPQTAEPVGTAQGADTAAPSLTSDVPDF